MSALEARAKPLFISILDSTNVVLDEGAQHVLSTWAIKSAMVFEALRSSRDWFYTPEERAQLRHIGYTSSRTYVWLAPVVDSRGYYSSGTDMADSPFDETPGTSGYVTTMAFGSVALQVLSIRLPPSVPPEMPLTIPMKKDDWEGSTLLICPVDGDVTWPTKSALNGELGLFHLHERWKL